MELIKPGREFDFMGKRWLFIGASLVLLALSAVSFWKPGPKLGTDFQGGTEVEVAFLAPVGAGEVRDAVHALGFEAPDVVSVDDRTNPNRYLIRVQEVAMLTDAQREHIKQALCLEQEGLALDAAACPEKARSSEVKFSPGGDKITVRFQAEPDLGGIATSMGKLADVKLRQTGKAIEVANARDHRVDIRLESRGDQIMDGLRAKLGADKVPPQALRVEWIGPKAGAQLRNAALTSVAISIVFIMLYIALRFDVRFAPGGIIALVHDVGIALGAMVFTGREITLSTVAALLTIVGYSITDTVVVYDRIRENLARHRNKSFSQVINLSISEMLGRTIIVSGVTALSMVTFLVWGTGVLKDFAFTLLVGIVVGTYSSIYIAAPITEWIDRRFFGATVGTRKKRPVPAAALAAAKEAKAAKA